MLYAIGDIVTFRNSIHSICIMVKKASGFLLFGLLLVFPLIAEPLRSLDELFQGLSAAQKRSAFGGGYSRTYLRNDVPAIIPTRTSGINLAGPIYGKDPSHIIETLLVVPYNRRTYTLLDAYNALGRISAIKNQLVFNSRRNMNLPVFEESTRLESDKRTNAVPDSPPSGILPRTDTMYLRLKDLVFGNLYIRADISTTRYGITCNLTNFKAVRYMLFTIMKVDKFGASIYMEPLEDGMLIYALAGIDVPDFIASRMNVSTNINGRVVALINWLREGLGAVR